MTIKRGERAVIGLLLVQKCRLLAFGSVLGTLIGQTRYHLLLFGCENIIWAPAVVVVPDATISIAFWRDTMRVRNSRRPSLNINCFFHLCLHWKTIWSGLSTRHLTFGRSAQKLLCSEFLCSPLRGSQQLDKVLHLSDLKNISSKHKSTQMKLTAAFLFTWAKLVDVAWRRQSCCYKCVLMISHWLPIWKILSPLCTRQCLHEGMLFVQLTLSVRTKGIHDG